jgi:hypothetical protein
MGTPPELRSGPRKPQICRFPRKIRDQYFAIQMRSCDCHRGSSSLEMNNERTIASHPASCREALGSAGEFDQF